MTKKENNKLSKKNKTNDSSNIKDENVCYGKNIFKNCCVCLNKFWKFVWYDDSLASWLTNILLAFIIIKFILYPFMGFVFGTSLPIVAVVSESMEHDIDFDTWWQSNAMCGSSSCTQEMYYATYNITKDDFMDFPLKNGFKRGDIIFLKGVKPENVEIGDVIVFNSMVDNSYPIIHRVIEINLNQNVLTNELKYSYQTKGDNNKNQIYTKNYLDEKNISQDDLLGKGIFKVPYVGYVKLIFVESFQYLFSVFRLVFN